MVEVVVLKQVPGGCLDVLTGCTVVAAHVMSISGVPAGWTWVRDLAALRSMLGSGRSMLVAARAQLFFPGPVSLETLVVLHKW